MRPPGVPALPSRRSKPSNCCEADDLDLRLLAQRSSFVVKQTVKGEPWTTATSWSSARS
jgi:hypothetical protein